jgi:hypothetical protein
MSVVASGRRHRPLTRLARRGERSKLETAGEPGRSPLMAVTIREMACVCADAAITGVGADASALSSADAAARAEEAVLGIEPADVYVCGLTKPGPSPAER